MQYIEVLCKCQLIELIIFTILIHCLVRGAVFPDSYSHAVSKSVIQHKHKYVSSSAAQFQCPVQWTHEIVNEPSGLLCIFISRILFSLWSIKWSCYDLFFVCAWYVVAIETYLIIVISLMVYYAWMVNLDVLVTNILIVSVSTL